MLRRFVPTYKFSSRIGAAAVVAVVGPIYWFSLSRDVGFWDIGELQTVPYILGLAHTTGFPTEILSGWLFTHALPLGSVAYRMTLLCSICSLVGAICCYLLALAFGASTVIGLGATVCYALTPVVWMHASRADVFDPTIGLAAATLLCAVYSSHRKRSDVLLLTALFGGLALGTHGVAVCYLPAAALVLVVDRRHVALRNIIIATVLGFAFAVLPYAYLPLRSCAVEAQRLDPTRALGLGPGMPIWDWGSPCRPADFVAVVTGSHVGAARSLPSYFYPARYPSFVSFAVAQLMAQYPVGVLIAAAGVGFVALWRTPTPAWVLLVPLVLVTPFAATFNSESDVARYFIFPLLCLWVAIAAGATTLSRTLARRFALPFMQQTFEGLLLALAVALLLRSHLLFEQRHDHLGSTYIHDVISSTEPNAIIVAPWVYATPLAYAAYVQHSLAVRTLVFGTADALGPQIQRWLSFRPVYAIAEKPLRQINQGATLVRRFNLTSSPDHDANLFRLRARIGRLDAGHVTGRVRQCVRCDDQIAARSISQPRSERRTVEHSHTGNLRRPGKPMRQQ